MKLCFNIWYVFIKVVWKGAPFVLVKVEIKVCYLDKILNECCVILLMVMEKEELNRKMKRKRWRKEEEKTGGTKESTFAFLLSATK